MIYFAIVVGLGLVLVIVVSHNLARRRRAIPAQRTAPSVSGSADPQTNEQSQIPPGRSGNYRSRPEEDHRGGDWEREADRLAHVLTDGGGMAAEGEEAVLQSLGTTLGTALGVEQSVERNDWDDLCWRARLRGLNVTVVLPNAEIVVRPVKSALSLSIWCAQAPGPTKDFEAVGEGVWVARGQRRSYEMLGDTTRQAVEAAMQELGLWRFTVGMDRELSAAFGTWIGRQRVAATVRSIPDPVRTLARAVNELVAIAEAVQEIETLGGKR